MNMVHFRVLLLFVKALLLENHIEVIIIKKVTSRVTENGTGVILRFGNILF